MTTRLPWRLDRLWVGFDFVDRVWPTCGEGTVSGGFWAADGVGGGANDGGSVGADVIGGADPVAVCGFLVGAADGTWVYGPSAGRWAMGVRLVLVAGDWRLAAAMFQLLTIFLGRALIWAFRLGFGPGPGKVCGLVLYGPGLMLDVKPGDIWGFLAKVIDGAPSGVTIP